MNKVIYKKCVGCGVVKSGYTSATTVLLKDYLCRSCSTKKKWADGAYKNTPAGDAARA